MSGGNRFHRGHAIFALCMGALAGVYGCGLALDSTAPTGLAGEVAAKATDVAGHVGGADGFGGTLMDGYFGHMPAHMGFGAADDLAGGGMDVGVVLINESDQACTVHLHYVASYMGLAEQTRDIELDAGEETEVVVPCAEIIGTGPLEQPGAPGCHLAAGEAIANTMSVPGFLGVDFACGGTFTCRLTPDVDDLDGDGDTEELILLSGAMTRHLLEGGPAGHMHGGGFGMMGPHMSR